MRDPFRPCHNNPNSVDLHAHPSAGAGERQHPLHTIMIISRDLYSSPPRAKSKADNNATLLVSWWCTGFALAIIVVRLAGRYTRTEKLFREDKIMALSIIPLLARMGLVHMVLIWGTNNAITTGLTPLDIEHREIGSKIVLASRITYAAFLWIAKFTVSEFLKRLTSQVWKRSYEVMLQFIRWFLVVTFAAVVIATLSECHPFRGYWQLIPDPGPRCRQGYAQLITMGSSDVITDLLLVCFPIPIVMKSAMPLKRKISLVLLFGLSLILIGITIYRVVAVIDRHSDQQFRSLLASLEILAAAAVSNALVLGSFVRDRGAKKQRFKFGSTGGSSLDRGAVNRRGALTARNWGSDADLVSDIGIRLEPELHAQEPGVSRPAPAATNSSTQIKDLTTKAATDTWKFPEPPEGAATDELGPNSRNVDDEISANRPMPTPRQMSFFDIGGLLDDDGTPALPRYQQAPILNTSNQQSTSSPRHPKQAQGDDFAIHHTKQGGSNALLQDIGGLLSSEPPGTPYDSSYTTKNNIPDSHSQRMPQASGAPHRQQILHPLRDVGGLLS